MATGHIALVSNTLIGYSVSVAGVSFANEILGIGGKPEEYGIRELSQRRLSDMYCDNRPLGLSSETLTLMTVSTDLLVEDCYYLVTIGHWDLSELGLRRIEKGACMPIMGIIASIVRDSNKPIINPYNINHIQIIKAGNDFIHQLFDDELGWNREVTRSNIRGV